MILKRKKKLRQGEERKSKDKGVGGRKREVGKREKAATREGNERSKKRWGWKKIVEGKSRREKEK